MTRRLLLLNGLAVLGVALHHASGYGFRAMFFWTDRYLPVAVPNYDQAGSLTFHAIVLIQQLDAFTLPVFMFVSGFFVAFAAGGSQGGLQWNVMMTRIKNLLVPFVLWSIIYFLISNRRAPATFDEVISRYYYIPLLSQYYLLSPLIVPLAKTKWKLLLVVLAFVELGTQSLQYFTALEVEIQGLEQVVRLLPKWLIPNLMFWFALGIVVGLHRQGFTLWLARVKWGLLAALVVLVPLTMFEYKVVAHFAGKAWLGPYFGGFSRTFYACVFILCFLAFHQTPLPLSKELSLLGGKSLGIYLSHAPMMYVAAVIMYRVAPWILGYQVLYQTVLITVGVGGALLLMSVLDKSRVRRTYRYAFG
ncbi:MAG: acyltransferase [Ardenticatenaceae bacterium]|nr:acyltransferase [Ardenticatenaceae bacterium]